MNRDELTNANGDALLASGMALFQENDLAGALKAFQQIVDGDAKSFDGQFWLAATLRRLGRVPEALAVAESAVALDRRNEHALNQLGQCFLDLGKGREAVECFERAIRISPNTGPLFDNLGRALQMLGRNKDAIAAYSRSLEIGPVSLQGLFRLGDAYMMEPDVVGAMRCARAILGKNPQSVQGNLLMSRALIGDGQVEEGSKYASRATELSPESAVAAAYFGRALQSLGKIQEADEQFRRSIDLQPHQGFAYHSLVHNHKVTEEERPTVATMERLAGDCSLPRREIIQLEYGLGKANEDLGDYRAAMAHFDEANRIDHELKVGVAPFSKEQLAETADFLISKFDAEFLGCFPEIASSSEMPIFVVGMMRSGTTLAEQILSSHSQVGGVGEQLFWPENAGSSEKVFTGSALNASKLRALGDEYLALLSRLAPNRDRVVDKMNTNYLLLGILHMVYPNARIIHLRRHPVDTCLSIWATPVAQGIDLCGDKSNVVFAYRQYLRIMSHWRSVLPSDRLLDVQYEELVSDQNRVTRQMVEFCGLDWDEACMKPEENVRSVKTPSVWQVRQPVYRTSMERWRRYEDCLGAFAELFEFASLN